TAVTFLRKMQASFPNLITKILTDNGLQFTRHKGDRQGHIFTQTCKELRIEHRTTQPFYPWTNGQVERMNRTIKEATVKKFYYENHGILEKHL
ncbi:MAG: IS481 family transposase, partial [Bacteroidota bacterium]